MPQPDPEFADLVADVTTPDPGTASRSRRVADAWEAVVREELLRVRRGHARDRRSGRPGDVPRPTRHRAPEGDAAA